MRRSTRLLSAVSLANTAEDCRRAGVSAVWSILAALRANGGYLEPAILAVHTGQGGDPHQLVAEALVD
jgi:hypothetical protein